MEKINNKNRSIILGKQYFFSDQNFIASKLEYVSGINYFDVILNGKSQQEIGVVAQLYSRPKGLELRLSKLFKFYSVGIGYDEIDKIILSNPENPNLEIQTKNNVILFRIKKRGFKEVVDFCCANFQSLIELNKVDSKKFFEKYPHISTYKKSELNARIDRLDYFLFTVSTNTILFIIYLLAQDRITYYVLYVLFGIVNQYAAVLRYQDIGKSWKNSFKVFIPLYNIYVILMLMTKKGDLGANEYGKNLSHTEPIFQLT